MPTAVLQPKQWAVDDELVSGVASWLGLGGGRGAAKSFSIDANAVARLTEEPGVVACIIMRTFGQVRKYHIEPMLRAFPELAPYYSATKGKIKLPTGDNTFSELDIGYAENYAAVETFFRSGNYKYIFVDQAEQFTEKELREIKKACRWPGGGAKMLLAFNMGGIGIGFLRKIFRDLEYNERENPADYKFIKVNPWDNCFWVTDALKADGLTVEDYYSWTDKQRMDYAATRGEYTRLLNSEDDAIRARDWFGSWDSLEGAYFSRVLDAAHTVTDANTVGQLIKPWWKRWMSGDWGSGHYTSYYWHTRGTVDPPEALSLLGLKVRRPISVVITYREWLGQGLSEREIGEKLIELSDAQECGKARHSPEHGMPEKIKQFYFSPDAFELSIRRSGQNTIAYELGQVLKAGGLPQPTKANNARVAGWRAMYGLLKNTKDAFDPKRDPFADINTIWLIADNCPELIKALPLLLRDPKKLEDVLKTDTTSIDISQDAGDGCRYGILCREVNDGVTPQEVADAKIIANCPDINSAYIMRGWIAKNRPKKADGIAGW
jgi:hypothetical protein